MAVVGVGLAGADGARRLAALDPRFGFVQTIGPAQNHWAGWRSVLPKALQSLSAAGFGLSPAVLAERHCPRRVDEAPRRCGGRGGAGGAHQPGEPGAAALGRPPVLRVHTGPVGERGAWWTVLGSALLVVRLELFGIDTALLLGVVLPYAWREGSRRALAVYFSGHVVATVAVAVVVLPLAACGLGSGRGGADAARRRRFGGDRGRGRGGGGVDAAARRRCRCSSRPAGLLRRGSGRGPHAVGSRAPHRTHHRSRPRPGCFIAGS